MGAAEIAPAVDFLQQGFGYRTLCACLPALCVCDEWQLAVSVCHALNCCDCMDPWSGVDARRLCGTARSRMHSWMCREKPPSRQENHKVRCLVRVGREPGFNCYGLQSLRYGWGSILSIYPHLDLTLEVIKRVVAAPAGYLVTCTSKFYVEQTS